MANSLAVVGDTVTAKEDFFAYDRDSLITYLKDTFDLPAFKAEQVFDWVYRKGVFDFALMSNLSKTLRDLLIEKFEFRFAKVISREISKDGTRKYLFEVSPNVQVESVMIKQPKRMTLCISSQYGCGMGCKFCRTATMGLKGSLTSGDIVRQVVGVINDAKEFGDMFSNVVFMGMGEPLHNLKNITKTIKVLKDPYGIGIAPRRITVSTVGLANNIRKFAAEELGVNLAVSLNATTDEIRSQIMPINKAFPIAELLSSLEDFPTTFRKLITIEYVMLHGLNDTEEDIKRLVRLMRGMPTKVNLIPYNENAGLGFKSPSVKWVNYWQTQLNNMGVPATVRWSKGQDINAACGQLKSKVDEA